VIYYTADQHFGHANIIRFCNRPFENVTEMDEALIKNWNNTVNSNDTVYILGNHDYKWIKNCNLQEYFASVSHYLEIKDGEKRIALCHYPMLTWGGAARGVLHAHAHLHNKREGLVFKTLKKMNNALNTGVEINQYRPVTLDELIINNERFKLMI